MNTTLYYGRSLAVIAGLTILLPVAMITAVIVFVLISAIFWMSAVHMIFTRYGHGETSKRFPVAERTDVTTETLF